MKTKKTSKRSNNRSDGSWVSKVKAVENAKTGNVRVYHPGGSKKDKTGFHYDVFSMKIVKSKIGLNPSNNGLLGVDKFGGVYELSKGDGKYYTAGHRLMTISGLDQLL